MKVRYRNDGLVHASLEVALVGARGNGRPVDVFVEPEPGRRVRRHALPDRFLFTVLRQGRADHRLVRDGHVEDFPRSSGARAALWSGLPRLVVDYRAGVLVFEPAGWGEKPEWTERAA